MAEWAKGSRSESSSSAESSSSSAAPPAHNQDPDGRGHLTDSSSSSEEEEEEEVRGRDWAPHPVTYHPGSEGGGVLSEEPAYSTARVSHSFMAGRCVIDMSLRRLKKVVSPRDQKVLVVRGREWGRVEEE